MEPYRNRGLGKHIQRIGCQPKKLLYTVANSARALLNREKKKKKKVWQCPCQYLIRGQATVRDIQLLGAIGCVFWLKIYIKEKLQDA